MGHIVCMAGRLLAAAPITPLRAILANYAVTRANDGYGVLAQAVPVALAVLGAPAAAANAA